MSKKKRNTKVKARRKKVQNRVSKVLSSGNSDYNIKQQYLSSLSVPEILSSFNRAAKKPTFYESIKLSLVGDGSNIYTPKMPSASFQSYYAWCLALLVHYKEKINTAVVIENNIFNLIVSNDFREALTLLDAIDQNVGLSIWSSSLRAAIENRIEFEINESKENTRLENPETNFLEYVKNYALDYYNDHQIFFTSCNSHAEDLRIFADDSVKDYLIYKLFGDYDFENLNYGKLFLIERNSSIYDIYHLFIEMAACTTVIEGDGEEESFLVNYGLNVLNSNFDDAVYDSASFFYDQGGSIKCKSEDLQIIDLYTSGNYSEVCQRANIAGLSSYDFSIFEIIVKSHLRCNELKGDGWLSEIAKHMGNVYLKNDQYNDSLQYLACESNSFKSLRWFRQLSFFVKREQPYVSTILRKVYDYIILMMSNVDTPKKSEFLSPNIVGHYLDSLYEIQNDSISVNLYHAITKNADIDCIDELNIDGNRKEKYLSSCLIDLGRYDEAIIKLYQLSDSNDEIVAIESSCLLIDALLKAKRFEEAVDNFVGFSLEKSNLFFIFDSPRILNALEEYLLISDSIDVPIAYSLNSRFISSRYDSNLKYSFENFLYKNEFRFPSDIFGKEEYFGREKLHYFFKWVCVPEVMKLYLEFESPRHIEECRLEVCNYLMESGDDSESLRNEVRDINKSFLVKKATKSVENSRIYVDTNTFLGRDSHQYEALFDRYLELSKKDYSSCRDEDVFGTLVSHIKGTEELKDFNFWASLSLIHVEKLKLNPKNATFLSLAKLMRQEFTFGDKGLNNHLSTRIRHGLLPTNLRKPLIEEGIFVNESVSFSEFRDNSVWHLNYTDFCDSDLHNLIKILKRFSSDYEEYISDLNDNRLQIYIPEGSLNSEGTGKKHRGMFDYSISPLECFALQKELSISPSYGDLARVVTNWLWSRTDYNLLEVQRYIKGEYKNKLFNLFDTLKDEFVEVSSSDSALSQFCNAVDRSKNFLSTQIDFVCTWFEHVDDEDLEEYEIETSIEIAKRTLNIDAEVDVDINCSLTNKNMQYMVDVFCILFENSLSKSNLPKDDLDINLRIFCEGGKIVVFFSNKYFSKFEVDKLNSDLLFYKEAYGDELLIRDVLQKEGGTGFFKIWKILEKDMDICHDIDMFFKDDGTFNICLVLSESKSLIIK